MEEDKLYLNPAGSEEVVWVSLDPVQHPKAYAKMVNEFLDSGNTEEEAKKLARGPFCLEVYKESWGGLFLVESSAVEFTPIYSPYTQQLLENPDEE